MMRGGIAESKRSGGLRGVLADHFPAALNEFNWKQRELERLNAMETRFVRYVQSVEGIGFTEAVKVVKGERFAFRDMK